MSFPRTTDVSKHMARKPHRSAAQAPESTPAAGSAKADKLKSLTEELSAAVNSAHNRASLDDRQ